MEFGVGGGMLIWSSEPHGQTSLVGYSPQGYKESDTTDKLTHFVLCRQTTKMPLNHECEMPMCRAFDDGEVSSVTSS